MVHPDEPVEVSTAEAGEIADEPSDVKSLEVGHDTTVGYLMKWEGAAWLYTDVKTTNWLRRQRSHEYDE